MQPLHRLASLLLIPVLCATSACRHGEGGQKPFQKRLESLLNALRPGPSPDEVSQALSRQLRTTSTPGAFPTRETLEHFYRGQGDRLAWCDESGTILPRTRIVLEALRDAGEQGLDPADYAPDRLEALQSAIARKDVSRLADFDLLVTGTFFRYASDLSTGRVHPDEVRSDWHTNSPEIDYVDVLSRSLEKDEIRELLEALAPPHRGYARLREALGPLRAAAAAGGWPVIPEGPSIGSGSHGPRVALLRRRLALEAAGSPTEGGSDRFDRALEQSVRAYQRQHGIDPDGRVRGGTLAELNRPVEQRIEQIELNLERWRWIPRTLGDPYLLVNIPGFDLQLVRGGETTWRTRVVTGKAYTPTPVFSDRIVSVLVNPPWNVPESIAVGEYLPLLRENPRALERQHLRLLEGSGDDAREVNPTRVDWRRVDEAHFPYRIRQDPGSDNALGRLKFELTNDFHIYLHDTPAGHLFGRSERDLSHGCIRVENPAELASRILGDSSADPLREALDQEDERRLPVRPPVWVHILYWTAWVDETGLRFGPDVYGLDGPQMAALDRAASRLQKNP